MLLGLAILCCVPSTSVQAPAAAAPPTIVRGTVLDERLQPLANVRIGLGRAAGDDAAALAAPLARTAADGTFRVEVPLQALAPATLVFGGDRVATMVCELGTGERRVDLGAFALGPGHSLTGRVRDESGAAVAGATVTASDLLDSRRFLQQARHGTSVWCRAAATTDANGIFRVHGAPRSAATLRVAKQGCYHVVLQPIGADTPLDVTLRAAPTIRGRVLDAGGAPVAGAAVSCGSATARSGDDGSFALALREPGVRTVTAEHAVAGGTMAASATLGDDEAGAAIELRLPAGPVAQQAPVRVVARAADGTALQAFRAFASWNPPDQLRYRPDALLLAGLAHDSEWNASARDGTATCRGTYRWGDALLVYVLADGHGLGRVETDLAAAAEPVAVELPPESILRGRVLDAATGAPVAGAEVIPTQRLTDDERDHHRSGFRDVADLSGAPTATRSAADGSYELRGLPPGPFDLFVHLPGRAQVPPRQFELRPGETRDGVDLTLPANVTLRGRVDGDLPAGAQVRLHWHRPNMWSSAWPFEFDGAVDVAADGTFALADVPPLPYLVELVAPVPPRSGKRGKRRLGEWNGAAPPDGAPVFAMPRTRRIAGTVRGDAPWSRLAVVLLPDADGNRDAANYELDGPLALLGPDRTFALDGDPASCHLLLFDVLTGVAIEWLRPDGDAEVRFAGRAVKLAVAITPGDETPRGTPCTLHYEPVADHWPLGVGVIGGLEGRTGMQTDARVGDTVELWLPARTGVLHLECNGAKRSVDLDTLRGGTDDRLEMRPPG